MKRGQSSKNKGQTGRLTTTKPFCDCQYCECKNCPDVLQKLAISTKGSKSACRIKGAKHKKSKDKKVPLPPPRRPSILDSLNPDRNCDCEIMARAIRPHIHTNIGMAERRERHSEHKPSYSKNID